MPDLHVERGSEDEGSNGPARLYPRGHRLTTVADDERPASAYCECGWVGWGYMDDVWDEWEDHRQEGEWT